jgi:CheY-like chemotaxis protein
MDINQYVVLLVEDEPGQLELTRMALEQTGEFRVVAVSTAKKALELMTKDHFDAIVSDYQMPGMNGIELLRSIRATDNRTPFLLFTGRGREEIAIAALNEGADFYVRKGMDMEAQFAELRNAIVQVVKRKGAEALVSEIMRSAPILMMVMDIDRRIYAPNDLVIEFAHLPLGRIVGKPCGTAFKCIHSTENEKGCGFSSSCGGCNIWRSVQRTITLKERWRRVVAVIQSEVDGVRRDVRILVSTSPIHAFGRDLALVCFEDVSELTEEPC